jgi:pimeloyl-ACP methyl ester carboxylesterase
MLGKLDVERIGSGPKVVLVHGSVVDGLEHGGDFDLEAPLFAELLGDGAHLDGHSFGGVIALLAAALKPDAVHSLTVSEPGLLRVAAGNPRIDELIEQGEQLYAAGRTLPPQQRAVIPPSGSSSATRSPSGSAPSAPWSRDGCTRSRASARRTTNASRSSGCVRRPRAELR